MAMARDMWLFVGIAGLLTAALSGFPSPAPSGLDSNSSTETEPLDSGKLLGVRLVNGSSRCSGSVEVWFQNSWEPVCPTPWNPHNDEAVCRALGCGGAGTVTRAIPPTPELSPGPTLENITGNSSSATNSSDSTWPLAAAVWCSDPDWRRCKVGKHACRGDKRQTQVTCAENRALRLVDGGGPCAGRVEMLERGEWGTVCDDSWDLEDAHVVCGQLRCGWAVQALPGLHFAPGQGPIHRDLVNCSGTEAHLWDCPGLPGNQYCGHKEDAGVVCSEHQSWRLTGGFDSCEGQVEVYFRGIWSTVCDSVWYQHEATVLCRALGCGSALQRPPGLPHALAGMMFYSCKGTERTLSDCFWRLNNSNLCSQSQAARVLCSGSRRLLNLTTPEVPGVPVTVEPSVMVNMKDKEFRELVLLIFCIVLGILFLGSLVFVVILLLKVKGRYALPVTVNHQQFPTTSPSGNNSYHAVPITIPKEVPILPIQPQAPGDSDTSSDSDYEHYDFSSQPPVALTTFYNSQRHRVTEEEVQQSRFQMPPLEEGAPSLGPQYHARSNSGSSTSSGEDYCNSPRNKPPPWNSQLFSSERSPVLEQPPNLELAGPQATFSGTSVGDSSSTSSGEWYQNFQSPPQPLPAEQFECPGPPDPKPDSTDEEDYDDIGAA